MGVVNVTPDSFSDGGRFLDHEAAVAQALELVSQGADILDLGAESTRPGYTPVPADEQCRRLLPVLEQLRPQTRVPISIDTTRAAVAAACLERGADWINDTSALQEDPDLAPLLAGHSCRVVLMHRFDPPRQPDAPVRGRAFVAALAEQLAAHADRAAALGIARERIVLDPGLGFGTLFDDSVALMADVQTLRRAGLPLLFGPSRKSFIGAMTGREPQERVFGTAAAVAALCLQGVEVLRVHDVAAMVDVVKVCDTLRRAQAEHSKRR